MDKPNGKQHTEAELLMATLENWCAEAERQVLYITRQLSLSRVLLANLRKLGPVGKAELDDRLRTLDKKKHIQGAARQEAIRQQVNLVLGKYLDPDDVEVVQHDA